jgi:hypothetical protein
MAHPDNLIELLQRDIGKRLYLSDALRAGLRAAPLLKN